MHVPIVQEAYFCMLTLMIECGEYLCSEMLIKAIFEMIREIQKKLKYSYRSHIKGPPKVQKMGPSGRKVDQ